MGKVFSLRDFKCHFAWWTPLRFLEIDGAVKPLILIDAHWTAKPPDHLMTPWSEKQVTHVCNYLAAKFLEIELLGQRVSPFKNFRNIARWCSRKLASLFTQVCSVPECLFFSLPPLKPVTKMNSSWILFRALLYSSTLPLPWHLSFSSQWLIFCVFLQLTYFPTSYTHPTPLLSYLSIKLKPKWIGRTVKLSLV